MRGASPCQQKPERGDGPERRENTRQGEKRGRGAYRRERFERACAHTGRKDRARAEKGAARRTPTASAPFEAVPPATPERRRGQKGSKKGGEEDVAAREMPLAGQGGQSPQSEGPRRAARLSKSGEL